MAIEFTNEGLRLQDTAAIRAKVAAEWKEAFKKDGAAELATEPETPAGQLIDGIAALIAEKDAEVLLLANSFNPAAATGGFQDALGKLYFLERKVEQPTLVTCQCRGLAGTAIPYGAIVADEEGHMFYNTMIYQSIGAGGVCECVFRCGEYGPIAVAAHAVTKIITVVSGWDSVDNAAAGVTGRDKETQSEFEQRRAASVAKNAHGLAEAVEGTVGNLPGVVACKIEQNRGGDPAVKKGVTIPGHSVYLSVYGGDKLEIGRAMHRKLDAGCGTAGNTKAEFEDETNGTPQVYYFQIPATEGCKVKVTLDGSGSPSPEAAAEIKKIVLANFNGEYDDYARVKMGDTVYASRFYKHIINAGYEGLKGVQIAFPKSGALAAVAEVPLDKMPVLAEADIEVAMEE